MILCPFSPLMDPWKKINKLEFIHHSNCCSCVLANRSIICQHLKQQSVNNGCVVHRLASTFLKSLQSSLDQYKRELGGSPLSLDCINPHLIPVSLSSLEESSCPTTAKSETIEQCKKSTAISPRPTSAKTVTLDQCNKKTY